MRLSIAKWFPAHSTNYSKGRLYPVSQITIHHVAGNLSTLRHLWQDPARNASSHFFVGNSPGLIEQYVSIDDTAWTNSNWHSNNRSITIEVNGDWRGGYHNQTALNNLRTLLREIRRRFPNAKLTYHMDEAAKVGNSTLCPADLKHRGYAKQVWDQVTKDLQPAPAPTPAPKPAISYKKITPKRVVLVRAANLWNFNFTDWSKAQAVASYPKGHVVDVVAEATNALGGRYYMTAWSFDDGKIRATNGFNVVDCEDFKEPTPAPKPEPKPEPEPEPAPAPEPELPDDEGPSDAGPGDPDIEERLSALERLVQSIVDFLKKIFKGFGG